MGDRGGEQASGGNSGILEGGRGVAGGGHCQLWTKHGKIISDIMVREMVCRRGVRAPKLCASRPSHQTGFGGGTEGNGGNHVGGYQHKDEVTVGRQGGQDHVRTGGQRAGQHDRPFHAKAAV